MHRPAGEGAAEAHRAWEGVAVPAPEGVCVLLTGFGSKYNLLNHFYREALRGEKCVVIEGFNPSFSLMHLVHLLCDSYFLLNYDAMRQDLLVGVVGGVERS